MMFTSPVLKVTRPLKGSTGLGQSKPYERGKPSASSIRSKSFAVRGVLNRRYFQWAGWLTEYTRMACRSSVRYWTGAIAMHRPMRSKIVSTWFSISEGDRSLASRPPKVKALLTYR
jgi:hypothetical protein